MVHAWETFEVVIGGIHGCSVLDREGGDMCTRREISCAARSAKQVVKNSPVPFARSYCVDERLGEPRLDIRERLVRLQRHW